MSRPDALSRAVVDAAFELHRRRLWQSTEGDAVFLIRIPDEPHPLAATIIGHSGTDYGIVIAAGAGAWPHMLSFVTEAGHSRTDSAQATILAITMDPPAKLPTPFRALLDDAGFSSRDGLAPFAMAVVRNRPPQPLHRSQLRTLLNAIRAVLVAHDAGEFRPTPVDSTARRVLELRVEGSGRDSAVKTTSVPWPDDTRSLEPQRSKRTAGAREVPQIDERWSAGLVLQQGVNRTIDGVRVLVVLRKPQGEVLGTTMLGAEEMDGARELLAKIFSGEARNDGVRGLPREIVFGDDALARECRADFAKLGVAVSVDRGDETLVMLEREMNADLDRSAASLDRAPPAVSPPTSLEEWKAADRAFTGFLTESTSLTDARAKRAMTRYFGSERQTSSVLSELASYQPLIAFLEWFVADYRPTKRSKTALESLLASQTLEPWQRQLIDARRNARLSVFRVEQAEPGSHFVVEDVLDGSRHTVHDRALSGALNEGLFIPLRLATVDRWTFPLFGGPPLSALMINPALLQLELLGVDLTPSGMRDGAHLVGRLWPFMLKLRDERPRIGNTDGETLEPQTATFKVGDVEGLRRAIAKRADIEFDDAEGLWVWLRQNDPKKGLGDVTLLGRLSLLDDQLVVEVNSAERLRRIRAWLDGLPGVRFQSSTSRAWDSEDRPLDDRLKGKPAPPPTPEMRKVMEESILKRNMAWLDQPIPLLNGLTPRQACATEDGRRRVARLIRTMPAVLASGGNIEPPRQWLLRELGLAE